jgi:pantetheine-phosphate adenylyltransferase
MNSIDLVLMIHRSKLVSELDISHDVIQECLAKYSEPHRYYHSFSHLSHLFDRIEQIDYPEGRNHKDELRVLALFHDSHQDTINPELNEEHSASYFEASCRNKKAQVLIDRIAKAIRDTAYSSKLEPSSQLSLDFRGLDFEETLFSSSFYDLVEYERGIMKEYQYVSYPYYKEKRLEFLEWALAEAPGREEHCTLLELKVWVDNYRPKIGVYAGTFNPFHIGHLNILEQAERVFDKVIILSAKNPDKWDFGVQQADALKKTLPYHEVVPWAGLTTTFLKGVQEYADVTLVRGLRDGYDLRYEANLRRFMEEIGECNVAYFLSGAVYQHISSSDVRALKTISGEDAARYLPTKYNYYEKI